MEHVDREREMPAPESHGADGPERQLQALYGRSLFGGWNDANEALAAAQAGRRERARARRPRWPLLVGLAAVAALTTWITAQGVERNRRQRRQLAAEEMVEFLKAGDFKRVERMLAELEPGAGKLREHDPHLDLMMRAEATLYRHHDADPARLRRIAPFFDRGERAGSYDRAVARALVVSRAERVALLDELRRVDRPGVRDPQVAFLIATVLERCGDRRGAAEHFARAGDLGPHYLPHLGEAALFYQRQNDANASLRVLGRMSDHDPRSAWTALGWQGHALFFGGEGQQPVAPADLSPVSAGRMEMTKALAALARREGETARPLLRNAVDRVRGQPPFLLDDLDLLLESGHTGAARYLVSRLDGQASVALTAARGRLLVASGQPGRAAGLLREAWERGLRDPLAARDLLRALRSSGGSTDQIERINNELSRLWPAVAEAEKDGR